MWRTIWIWLGIELGVKQLADWYKFTIEDFKKHGGSELMRKYFRNSPARVLQTVYPQHKFITQNFQPHKIHLHTSWNDGSLPWTGQQDQAPRKNNKLGYSTSTIVLEIFDISLQIQFEGGPVPTRTQTALFEFTVSWRPWQVSGLKFASCSVTTNMSSFDCHHQCLSLTPYLGASKLHSCLEPAQFPPWTWKGLQ